MQASSADSNLSNSGSNLLIIIPNFVIKQERHSPPAETTNTSNLHLIANTQTLCANNSSSNFLVNLPNFVIKQEQHSPPAETTNTGNLHLIANSSCSSSNNSSNFLVNLPNFVIKEERDYAAETTNNNHNQNNPNIGNQNRSNNELPKERVKKPLNAFMIYMMEMRPKVAAESTLQESPAINQIIGKMWKSLNREEQEIYYEKARKERELHMQKHPGWTAKDNYAVRVKRRKKFRIRDGVLGVLKKCRARFGPEQRDKWCKPCRRKKKCVRNMEALRAPQQQNQPDKAEDDGQHNGTPNDEDDSKCTEEESGDHKTMLNFTGYLNLLSSSS